MALRLVNTTPGDIVEPLLPGRPVVFGIRSDVGHVDVGTVVAKLGSTNCVHRPGFLPELNEPLLKKTIVILESPEHIRPLVGEAVVALDGASLLLSPGPSGSSDACVYELHTNVETYAPVLATVSFRVDPGWSRSSYFWSNKDSLVPVYLGLEYGIRNTGVFLALRDDGGTGSLVVGGPLQAFSTPRPAQVEIPFPWIGEDEVTLGVYIDPNAQRAYILSSSMEVLHEFDLSALGEFLPETSSFSQRRAGPSTTAILYFGNSSGTDTVVITDYSLYRNFPVAVDRAYARSGHSLRSRPDLPYSFFSFNKTLPTDVALGRWAAVGADPDVSFWYQPGRKSVPLYAEIAQKVGGQGYLRRVEPRLAERLDGFSIEAWMAGEASQPVKIDSCFGMRVGDGQKLFQVEALLSNQLPTYGLVKDLTFEGELPGYWVAGGNSLAVVDYTSLKLVRLTVDRRRGKVLLFIEDPNTPFLEVPLSSMFPTTSGSFIELGVLSSSQYPTKLKLASANYMTRYLAWEAIDGDPASAPVDFTLVPGGGGVASDPTRLLITDKAAYSRASDVTYQRGFQVDFRARVESYASATVQDAPNRWTGAGVTIYLGSSESPNSLPHKIHVGFFDCGAYGRKVAIVPENGYDDIIKQTPRGKKHSADLAWDAPLGSVQNLRLVYRPFDVVELWGQGLIKDAPIISIPWSEFEVEKDLDANSASIVFGNFATDGHCVSEWQYLRWGVSTGYEAEITQDMPDPTTVMGGRTLLLLDVEEKP